MADQGVVEAAPPLAAARSAFQPAAILRLLFADRLGIIFLLWLVLAFLVRPVVMDAHHGVAGGLGDWVRARVEPFPLARIAGAVQWGSLAGLVVVLALAHVRLAAAAPVAMEQPRNRFLIGAAYAAALTLGYAFFVWSPVTAVSLMLHDTFIFFDAMHRIDAGQRPSVDFPTPLGAAMLYLPWLGSKISGGYAGAIEISSVMVSLGLCLACAQACARRHSSVIAAVLIAAIFLMVVPPMLEGYVAPDSVTRENGELMKIDDEFAVAMFYNRWGWGTLIAIFAFLAPRNDEDKTIAETVTLGVLLAFLFWLKLSYFMVGGAAAVLYAFLGSRPWRTLSVGAGVLAVSIAVVAVATGNLFAYVGDLLLTAKVSGARFGEIPLLIKDNLLVLAVALSPMLAIGLMGRIRAVDLWVTGLIFLGTLFIINQNAQSSGVPTMLVAATYAIWRLQDEHNRALRLLAVLALALPAASFILERGAGLLDHTTVARREEARPAPPWAGIPALAGLYAQERENLITRMEGAATDDERQAAFREMSIFGRRQYLRSGEYLATLMAGVDELKPVLQSGESVVVMDFSSPLALMMGARPAKGYWLTFDDGRTISGDVHPAADQLFADADHVMLPKLFADPDTSTRLRLLYSEWLDGAYLDREETAYWIRWSYRKPVLRPATQMALIPAVSGP